MEMHALLSYTKLMTKHYYSLSEAEALLPEISQKMALLQQARQDIALRHLKLAQWQDNNSTSESQVFQLEAEIEFIILSARQQIESLHNLCIEIKDISQGIVDFLTVVDGVEGYLCWRQGERRILYWHGLDEGYAGRKRLMKRS